MHDLRAELIEQDVRLRAAAESIVICGDDVGQCVAVKVSDRNGRCWEGRRVVDRGAEIVSAEPEQN